ncbi:transporter substrate-binding domain-containing protein [candidate division KSB1 bacterium]|nr:transporter substrate-binding domain-containing protein [candidate division KSB1 bacterium]
MNFRRLNLYNWNWFFPVLLFLTFFNYTTAFSKELVIAFPANLPPWTLEKKDAGIIIEIVRKSFEIQGYSVKTRFLSLKELNQAILSGIDAHAQVESSNLKGYYSSEVSYFQTSLISLKPHRFKITTIDDLKDRKIIAFQNASLLFGEAFHNMAQHNPFYEELADQEEQVVRFYNGQTEFILIDKNIFLYFRRITTRTNTSMSIQYHQISGLTEVSPAFVVFRDKKLRDDFNIGLKLLKENGDYYDIIYNYTN